jgi:hypothetical protein
MNRFEMVDVAIKKSHSFLTGEGNFVRASGDGRVWGLTKNSGSPGGYGLVTFNGSSVTTFYEHTSPGVVMPNLDGSLILTTREGVYKRPYTRINGSKGSRNLVYIPSYHPHFYVRAQKLQSSSSNKEKGEKPVAIFTVGRDQPLIFLNDSFEETRAEKDDQWSKEPLTVDKRYHFIPQIKRLITIALSNDYLKVRPVDIRQILEEKQVEFLYISSFPHRAQILKPYRYQLRAESNNEGISFNLESGPEGLKVSHNGLVSWQPGENFADQDEAVIVLLKDSSGQEQLHTFHIAVDR